MTTKILLVSLLILMGNQLASGQDSSVKGRIVDYETNAPIHAVTVVLDPQHGVLTDKNGNFEIKGNTKKVEISFVGYYAIKFMNTPLENKQTDLGDIKLVPDYRDAHVIIGGPPSQPLASDLEKDKKLRENVLENYRFKVFGKTLKPYFEHHFLVFDFDENEKK